MPDPEKIENCLPPKNSSPKDSEKEINVSSGILSLFQATESDLKSLTFKVTNLAREKKELTTASHANLRKVLLEFIEVADNFERLFKSFESQPPKEGNLFRAEEEAGPGRRDDAVPDDPCRKWIENFRTVYKIHMRALKRAGVALMKVGSDEKVDPTLHQVSEVVSHPEKPNESILEVVKNGYFLNNELLRPAEVIAVKK